MSSNRLSTPAVSSEGLTAFFETISEPSFVEITDNAPFSTSSSSNNPLANASVTTTTTTTTTVTAPASLFAQPTVGMLAPFDDLDVLKYATDYSLQQLSKFEQAPPPQHHNSVVQNNQHNLVTSSSYVSANASPNRSSHTLLLRPISTINLNQSNALLVTGSNNTSQVVEDEKRRLLMAGAPQQQQQQQPQPPLSSAPTSPMSLVTRSASKRKRDESRLNDSDYLPVANVETVDPSWSLRKKSRGGASNATTNAAASNGIEPDVRVCAWSAEKQKNCASLRAHVLVQIRLEGSSLANNHSRLSLHELPSSTDKQAPLTFSVVNEKLEIVGKLRMALYEDLNQPRPVRFCQKGCLQRAHDGLIDLVKPDQVRTMAYDASAEDSYFDIQCTLNEQTSHGEHYNGGAGDNYFFLVCQLDSPSTGFHTFWSAPFKVVAPGKGWQKHWLQNRPNWKSNSSYWRPAQLPKNFQFPTPLGQISLLDQSQRDVDFHDNNNNNNNNNHDHSNNHNNNNNNNSFNGSNGFASTFFNNENNNNINIVNHLSGNNNSGANFNSFNLATNETTTVEIKKEPGLENQPQQPQQQQQQQFRHSQQYHHNHNHNHGLSAEVFAASKGSLTKSQLERLVRWMAQRLIKLEQTVFTMQQQQQRQQQQQQPQPQPQPQQQQQQQQQNFVQQHQVQNVVMNDFVGASVGSISSPVPTTTTNLTADLAIIRNSANLIETQIQQ